MSERASEWSTSTSTSKLSVQLSWSISGGGGNKVEEREVLDDAVQRLGNCNKSLRKRGAVPNTDNHHHHHRPPYLICESRRTAKNDIL